MASLSKPPAVASTSTLQRIPTSQLRPGMFLVRILDSWWKSPFFVHRRLLKSPTDVQQLMSSGIREVEIDTSLGVEVSSEAESEFDEDAFISEETDMPLVSCGHDESTKNDREPGSLGPESTTDSAPYLEESKNRTEVVQLREATVAAVQGAFEGAKTGQPISRPDVHAAAQALVHKTLANPALVAEILLIDSLKQFNKTLYAHVVDTAVYSILVGLQLGWDEGKLEKVGVAGLLHDVGYMRLPQNVVKAHWDGRSDAVLLQQHVEIGETLIQRQAHFSADIVQMVGEHHAYRDGSGYPEGHAGAPLSESGELLGIVDYFDELITVGGISGSLPAALAIRRLYQEAQKGKFSVPFIEAMIRTLGVFPVGTVVQLSTGEQAVVMKQHAEMGLKPKVKIFRGSDRKILDVPQECDLSKDASLGHDMSIAKVLDPTEYSLDLQEYFHS
jgi:HD-GYP domain-containing protein (c-di-GMP phosphodiesterase class II)